MPEVRYPESGGAYRAARTNAVVEGAKVSQRRLAEAVGVDPRTIKRYERGDHRPWPELRDRIATYLGVDKASLPSASEDPFASSEVGAITLSSSGFTKKFSDWLTRRLR